MRKQKKEKYEIKSNNNQVEILEIVEIWKEQYEDMFRQEEYKGKTGRRKRIRTERRI